MPDLREGCATGKYGERTAPADALVLFGAMGDLAHKKIFRANCKLSNTDQVGICSFPD
jgi:glucose-6-phosphate 1-dehydrogenase